MSKNNNSIRQELRVKIKGMLANLPDLWPSKETSDSLMNIGGLSAANERNNAAQKAAQARVLAKMKKMQASEKKLVTISHESLQ